MTFLETITAASSPATKKGITSLWKNWLEGDIHEYSASGLVNIWLEAGLKPETIRKLLTIYQQWHRWYTGDEIDLRQLKKHVSRMKVPSPAKALTERQAQALILLSSAWDPWLHDMVIMTLHTGMRKGEMFGLKWEDLDFDNKKINIVRSYDGPTKSGKPRSIPMSDKIVEVMTGCYNQQRGDEFCFNRCDPNPRLKKICKEVHGKPNITWHGLRHTFATLALEAGRSPKLVSEMLGHTKVSTTLDLYWNKTGEDLDLGFLPKGDFK